MKVWIVLATKHSHTPIVERCSTVEKAVWAASTYRTFGWDTQVYSEPTQ